MFGLMSQGRFRLWKKAYLNLLREKNDYIQILENNVKELEQKLRTVEATLMIAEKKIRESKGVSDRQGEN